MLWDPIYGFLQGAWPFGLVEAIWCFVALRRWWLANGPGRSIRGEVKNCFQSDPLSPSDYLMANDRKRPEDFLELVERAKRGRLKVYIGSAAGVGKTYQMLEEAHA